MGCRAEAGVGREPKLRRAERKGGCVGSLLITVVLKCLQVMVGLAAELIILMLLFVPKSLASTLWVEGQERRSCS